MWDISFKMMCNLREISDTDTLRKRLAATEKEILRVAKACGCLMTNHHHALADAEACAYIAMRIL